MPKPSVENGKQSDRQVKKICGADVELGNFISGVKRAEGTGCEAANRLLAEIDGLPLSRRRTASSWSSESVMYSTSSNVGSWHYDPQDRDRRYLATNGGCAYIDLDHLELCLPEVLSAYDHVAAWHAMLRLANTARIQANTKLPESQELCVMVNNSDGIGHSYGSHLNFLISRAAWENIFHLKPHYLSFLASYQASSIIFTGQGKVGSEHGMPHVPYQISQRADFFEALVGSQTTYKRPIVNTRDEPLCASQPYARLHSIFYDNSLCESTCLLKVGVMQIILSMIEADCVNPRMILDDSLGAVHQYSHDPSLSVTAQMASGARHTALECQFGFAEEARKFVDSGGCEGMVPEAHSILALWEDTLSKLDAQDFDALTPRLDWVLKRSLLERAMGESADLSWDSLALKHLDQMYGSLDPSRGLFWSFYNEDFTERVVSDAHIDRFLHEPPENTRAWTRAMLLRKADPESVVTVNWDQITVRDRRTSYWYKTHTVELDDPTRFTREETEDIFEESNFSEVVASLNELSGETGTAIRITDHAVYGEVSGFPYDYE